MNRKTVLHRLAWAFVLLVALAGAADPPPTVRASGPCSAVQTDPGPPSGDPQPMVGGQVTDADTSAGISGATVRLYRCNGQQTPILVTTLTTDAQGAYGSGSLSQAWYYVRVELTGLLAGMQPASGTANPTAVIEVGAGDPDVDLAFE